MTEPTVHPERKRVLGGHIAAGIVSGTLFGFAYFLLEAMGSSWGHTEDLGGPLARILETYLIFGLATGAVVGIVAGTAAAVWRSPVKADSYVPFYLSNFVFLLVFMYVLGKRSMGYVKSFVASVDVFWYLVLLIGLWALAYAWARFLRRTRPLSRIGGRKVFAVTLACGAVIGIVHWTGEFSCWRLSGPSRRAASNEPNIVLIVLDAFRADHLSAVGYHRNTTPVMDELAREGVLFRRAYSHGNRTAISVPSIFTSLYPSVHGAGSSGRRARPLADEWTTIAEFFRDHGYATVGLVPNGYFSPQFNFMQGFDRVDRFLIGRYDLGLYRSLRRAGILHVNRLRYRPSAAGVTDTALGWLEKVKGRPIFMYIHYMDTHHPYAPPPRYRTLWGERADAVEPIELFDNTTRWMRERGAPSLTESEIATLIDYYDGSIRFVDEQIGRMVDKMRREKSRETIIVVTADHGDEFLEHGLLYHTNIVIEELIHVPLVFWSSERFQRGTEVDDLVRHIDLFPTFADLIGAVPPIQVWGKSLVPFLEGKRDSLDRQSIAEGDYCASVNFENWKLVKVDSTDSYYFYDLSRSPREKDDVCASFQGECAALRAQMEEYFKTTATVKKQREIGLDEKTIRELKALGYL